MTSNRWPKPAVAMITNLRTEDNLPSYHRTIAEYFTIGDARGHG